MKFVNEETATFTDTDTLAYIYSYSLSITGILRPYHENLISLEQQE